MYNVMESQPQQASQILMIRLIIIITKSVLISPIMIPSTIFPEQLKQEDR